MYYLGAAASSVALGRVVERVGGLRVMRWACSATGLLLTVLASVVRSWMGLVAKIAIQRERGNTGLRWVAPSIKNIRPFHAR